MEHLLAAIVQAVIAGLFGLIAVYLGHWLRNRKSKIAIPPVEFNRVSETTQPLQSSMRTMGLLRHVIDVLVALLFALGLADGLYRMIIDHLYDVDGLIIYSLAIFAAFLVLALLFKEPRWFPISISVPVLAFADVRTIEHHHYGVYFDYDYDETRITVAVIAAVLIATLISYVVRPVKT